MTDTMLGADPQQLRNLAKDFSQAAQQLTELSTALTQRINRPGGWKGPDADRFRSQWNGSHRSKITAASKCFDQTATALLRNAQEQEQASDASGIGSNPGFPGIPGLPGGPVLGPANGDPAEGDDAYTVFMNWKAGLLDVPGWLSVGVKGADFLHQFDPALGWKLNGALWKELPNSALKSVGEALAGDNWDGIAKGAASFLNDKAFYAALNDSKFAGTLANAGEGLSTFAKGLGTAGRALGPLGVVIGGVSTVVDFAEGDYARGGYDAVMTGLGTAALLTPPPADLILGGGALLMGAGELAYDHIPGFKNAVDGTVGAIEDTAQAVGKGVEKGWDNVTHGKWPWG
ncbi:MAG: WXG100 family type VII secretion target [Specibacter sp.]